MQARALALLPWLAADSGRQQVPGGDSGGDSSRGAGPARPAHCLVLPAGIMPLALWPALLGVLLMRQWPTRPSQRSILLSSFAPESSYTNLQTL